MSWFKKRHRKHLMAKSFPAEFFAVATEFFFEKPIEFKPVHPDLYEQLTLFYRRDPASIFKNARTEKNCYYFSRTYIMERYFFLMGHDKGLGRAHCR